MTEDILQAIYGAIDEINQQLPVGNRLEKSIHTTLYGASGKLDSLALVNLILAVEERIDETFGVAITIADERAMSQESSPFRSVETLANYLTILLREHAAA